MSGDLMILTFLNLGDIGHTLNYPYSA
jgi:hypothetical protein